MSTFRQTLDEGIARIQARRRAEQKLAEVAREYPELAAREKIVFARTERDRLRRELVERLVFSISRKRSGFRCSFVAPERRPKGREESAEWLDRVVALVGFEIALDGMWLAAAYSPPPDRARMICNAFSDVMRETPAAYAAFANCQEEYASGAKNYASAMLAAWVRSYLKSYRKTRAALEGPNWASELAAASLLAFQELDELDSDAQIKRSTRFRDTLPRQKDGRRQRASGLDLVNLVDRSRSAGARRVDGPRSR